MKKVIKIVALIIIILVVCVSVGWFYREHILKVHVSQAKFELKLHDPITDEWQSTDITERNIKNSIQDINSGNLGVSVILDKQGRELLNKISSENVGKQAGLFLDGTIISAPTIQAPINSGELLITGVLTPEDAKNLSYHLRGYSYKPWWRP